MLDFSWKDIWKWDREGDEPLNRKQLPFFFLLLTLEAAVGLTGS